MKQKSLPFIFSLSETLQETSFLVTFPPIIKIELYFYQCLCYQLKISKLYIILYIQE